uniref:SCP domain-containing protein n=2 Tax=Mesocestoides corti TaxID=53468 RepID=A0A5K3EGT0_MESCO
MQIVIYLLGLVFLSLIQALPQRDRYAINGFARQLREKVQPTASNMQLMTYSMKMELLAEEYATHCSRQSPSPSIDPEYPKLGMISWVGSGTPVQFRIYLSLVTKEKKMYNFAKSQCQSNCERYLQFVWANSTKVGCATHWCPRRDASSRDFDHIAVCFFDQKRTENERPYEEGPSCSKCSPGHKCHHNQCAKNPEPAVKPPRPYVLRCGKRPCSGRLLINSAACCATKNTSTFPNAFTGN